MNKRVLSVGNCSPDHRAIAAVIEHNFPAKVLKADHLDDTLQQLRANSYDLVLVNRQLDRDGSDGIEVIRQIKADPAIQHVPVMLISNFPDAQHNARQAGAEEGFGKRTLHTTETLDRLRSYLTD